MAGEQIGASCKLYYNSGTHASPTWVLVANAVDARAGFGKNYGDGSSRASGWKKNLAALRDLSCSFGYRYKAGADTVWDALQAAAIANTPKELFFADGASGATGTEGFRAYFDLVFDQDQPLEDGVTVQFEGVHVAYYESSSMIDPDWYVVS